MKVVDNELQELLAINERFAWHEAKQLVKIARDFKTKEMRVYFVQKAMWHRAHAKELRNLRNET